MPYMRIGVNHVAVISMIPKLHNVDNQLMPTNVVPLLTCLTSSRNLSRCSFVMHKADFIGKTNQRSRRLVRHGQSRMPDKSIPRPCEAKLPCAGGITTGNTRCGCCSDELESDSSRKHTSKHLKSGMKAGMKPEGKAIGPGLRHPTLADSPLYIQTSSYLCISLFFGEYRLHLCLSSLLQYAC